VQHVGGHDEVEASTAESLAGRVALDIEQLEGGGSGQVLARVGEEARRHIGEHVLDVREHGK
jgi:hypothetical protein